LNEDKDRLFVKCVFFRKIMVDNEKLFGIEIVPHSFLADHFMHFEGLWGCFKYIRLTLRIIWISTVWLIWKERNGRIFQQKDQQLH